MPDDDRSLPKATAGDRIFLIVGGLVVALVVGAYVLMGAPGLHSQIANAPGARGLEIAAQRPTPAPAR